MQLLSITLITIFLLLTELSLCLCNVHNTYQLKLFTLETPFDDFEFSLLSASLLESQKLNTGNFHKDKSKEYAVGFDETSYVKVRAPKDYGTYLALTFLIKLQQPNGLIYLLLSIHHHFAIYLEDAFLTVHYEIADDYEILRSQHPLLLNKWHRIETDHRQWVESHINGTGRFDEDENSISYFGGAPALEIPLSLGKLNGFSGCLRKVYQNGRFVDLTFGALHMQNVHRCGWDACATTHCEGRAQCTVYRAEPYCKCQFPSFGTLCEKSMRFSNSSHQSLLSDQRDHYNSSIAHLRFDRFSYLKLSDQDIMKQFYYLFSVAGEKLNFSFMILLRNKTNNRSLASGDQILACTSENELVGDYLNLLLSSDNEVKLIVNLGSGPAALTHPTILEPDDLWHNITVLRNGRHISLSVDELSISSVTPGTSVELNVYDAFYIGGLSKIKPSLMGFIGCISHIRIGTEEIESPVKATEAVNIADCFEERK
uniref:EGF-like domain-containing protein n=1 Tax=Setaria digitata TaxID=48799 RepID=A0A915Q4P0_9BILA